MTQQYTPDFTDSDMEEGYKMLAQEIRQEKDRDIHGMKKWGSTPRWHKGLTITEKINGTNACVKCIPISALAPEGGIFSDQEGIQEYVIRYDKPVGTWVKVDNTIWLVQAQSRNNLITPEKDNAGFAKYVWANAEEFVRVLGFGMHYGEWFGPGIQKNPLGVAEKRFALFHALKYTEGNGYDLSKIPNLETVPVLFHGQANIFTIPETIQNLETYGTQVKGAKVETVESTVPGVGDLMYQFDKAAEAEGVIVWHKETQEKYKILLKDDAYHKFEVNNG